MKRTAQLLKRGDVFQGRYRVESCLGEGGMGVVYEVVHTETHRRSALKIMLPAVVRDAELRARFKREARITADIKSDHIVQVFDAGIDDRTGAPYLVMEIVDGEELDLLMQRRKRLDTRLLRELLAQLARALDKTHAAGIIHRDLKPSNLMLTEGSDGRPRLKILDFGIAKVLAESRRGEETGQIGTPIYMAPEQMSGSPLIGPAADQYAVAHIVFMLLVGRPYWFADFKAHGNTMAFFTKVIAGAKQAPSLRAREHGAELPSDFDAWFLKATAIDPKSRFATVGGMVAALGPTLTEGVVYGEPKGAYHQLEELETLEPPSTSTDSRPPVATMAVVSRVPSDQRTTDKRDEADQAAADEAVADSDADATTVAKEQPDSARRRVGFAAGAALVMAAAALILTITRSFDESPSDSMASPQAGTSTRTRIIGTSSTTTATDPAHSPTADPAPISQPTSTIDAGAPKSADVRRPRPAPTVTVTSATATTAVATSTASPK